MRGQVDGAGMENLDTKSARENRSCEIHGTHHKSANRMLLAMVLMSVAVVIWHVWVYGPTNQAAGARSFERPFYLLLGYELWDMMFSGRGIVAELRDVFPYFIIGILLAGYIRTYKLAIKLRLSLNRYGFLSIFLASVLGILTPLCACGTLTTAVSLLFAGLPLAPVMALLVTSPLLSPSAYLLTLNDLGPEWTVIRTVAAFAMGIFAGSVTYLLRNRGFQTETIFIEGAIPRGDFHDEAYPDERLRCNCKEKFGNRVAAKTKNMFIIFLAKSSEMLWLVGKYVLVGVALGTIVERYMPYEWIYRLFGQKDKLSIVWITLGSVPIFLHQISASSILYHIKSTLHGTLDGGAGLAFLIGGPVTAMPTMVMFWTIFKKRVFFLYLFVCIVGTMLIAYTFQLLIFVPYVDTGNPLLKGVRSVSGGHSSIVIKNDSHVRAVMDPGGNSIIAVYQNDIDGKGNVVFDGGLARFLNVSAENDNGTYVKNIAEWLRQDAASAKEKKILIYEAREGTETAGGRSLRGAADILEKKAGFKIVMTDRKQTPEISQGLIGEYSELWFVSGDSGVTRPLTDSELDAISAFNNAGKGILIVAAKDGGRRDETGINRLASRFGAGFSGSVENKEELPVSTGSYFLGRASGALGIILKFVHKA